MTADGSRIFSLWRILVALCVIVASVSIGVLLLSPPANAPRIYTSLDKALHSPQSVQTLCLDNQGLTEVPTEVKQLTYLRELYLIGNRIEHLPEWIVLNPHIVSVWLVNDHLSTFPSELSRMGSLRSLRLNDNSIETLPAIIGKLPLLDVLDLENNRIKALPREIGQLDQLTGLFLSNNKLQELPPEIGMLDRLERLSVRNNHLMDFPNEIGQLVSLKYLWVNGNCLGPNVHEKLRRLLPHTIIDDCPNPATPWGNEGSEKAPVKTGRK